MLKTVLFQTFQLSISAQFISTWPMDRNVLSATTTGRSGPGTNGYEQVLPIHQSSSITETSPSNCLMSYPEHSLEESSTGKHSVYSAASVV